MNSILFIGGTRSGKSELAEKWVSTQGSQYLFVATAKIEDDETQNRVETHKNRRGNNWQCLELPLLNLSEIEKHIEHIDAVLIDCLTMWLNNKMACNCSDEDILQAADDLAVWVENCPLPIAIVTSELGQGMVPMSALARRYRDLHGLINQRMAKHCKTVLMVSCALPFALKGALPKEL